jgi:hypothetical protein
MRGIFPFLTAQIWKAKSLDRSRQPDREARSVQLLETLDASAAFAKASQHFGLTIADARNETQPGNDNLFQGLTE